MNDTSGEFVCNKCMDDMEWDYTMYSCVAPKVVCMEDCILCQTADYCDMCNIGFVYNDVDAVCEMDATCEEGKYMDTLFNVCTDCIKNCNICGNGISCSQCYEGYSWEAKSWSC
jgi:hypothetical protein